MIHIVQAKVIDDGPFRFMVILIAAILIVSILITAFPASGLPSLRPP